MLITLGRLASIACLISALAVQAHAQEMPQRGTSKAAVEQIFGTPLKKHSPVGTPPITRWDYQGYSVYFEGNTTLHSVSHHTALIRRTQPTATPLPPSSATHTTHHGTVLVLPEIEEVAPASVSETTIANDETANTIEDNHHWDGSFRFDPATGRIVPSAEPNDTTPNPTEDKPKKRTKKDQTIEPTIPTPAATLAVTEEDREDKTQEKVEIGTEAAPVVETTESNPPESNESGGFQMNW